uniref:TauD/TfdA-like domain-containing protein n=1 Tax=Noctiluca scintillans TaxID=2966 RepID=A0A7S1AZ28_NOCSC|mmetsp:Transcript_65716/g.174151  ORF Transcript_65716/g.174151 Transcript_65716/m.174151 type:complete len:314 (+) Transcript_65716:88-1029(+)
MKRLKDHAARATRLALSSARTTHSVSTMATTYTCEPILPHFGAYIRDFSLDGRGPLPQAVVDAIKDDLRKHRVLVFKGQGRISGERQVEISKQLGGIESTFYKHPRSPHPDIFRVSNDAGEGCTNVGRTGWHVDGTFLPAPFKYQTMHFHSVCEGGETWFVPLRELYEMQDEATRAAWDKMWMVTGRGQHAHPLVFKHPIRGDTTMCFHCGDSFCDGWIVDGDTADARRRLLPPSVVQAELTERCNAAIETVGVKMVWEEGDFAINDNIGNCHYATPGTQNKKARAGLRILHRTTIAGEDIPTKEDGRQSFIV